MKINAIKTSVFRPRQDLLAFINKYIPDFFEKDILVVTSKIVALGEGRLVKKTDKRAKLRIIRQESEAVLRTKHVCLTIKDGMALANAGVDESNADGQIILLPQDSFRAAAEIRQYFKNKYRLKKFGVIITDSRCLPLRAGITGIALGYAGFKGLKDYRRKKDIFGRPFKFSRVDVADSLATAAVLIMGEGREQQPLAVIKDAPAHYISQVDRGELKISIQDDIYGPLFRKFF